MTENISFCEWEIMRVVWHLGDCSAQDIIQVMTVQKDWKKPTVKTFLHRLVKKGVLDTKKVGNKFIYHATLSENIALTTAGEGLIKSICPKKIGQLLSEMIVRTSLTPEDIEKVTQALNEATVVKTIACTCLPQGKCTC